MERIGETDTKPKDMNLTTIEVGVLFAPTIRFRLNGIFRHQGRAYHGEYSAAKAEGKIWLTGPDGERQEAAAGLTLEPDDYAAADFDLLGVTIGIHFHWERQENQKFKGSLRIIDEGEHLTAVNLLPVEEYLTSVISSEMKATSHPDLLKDNVCSPGGSTIVGVNELEKHGFRYAVAQSIIRSTEKNFSLGK